MNNFFFDIKLSRKDWAQSEQWSKEKILRDGSAVVESAFMYNYELEWATDLYNTSWYRSKEKKADSSLPFASYLLNKKWTMEEEFNKHMMRFQQVRVSSIYFRKLHFDFPGWIGGH